MRHMNTILLTVSLSLFAVESLGKKYEEVVDEGKPYSERMQFHDRSLGTLEMKMTVVGEPINKPVAIEIRAKCREKKRSSASSKNKTNVVNSKFKVCDYQSYRYDRKSKTLKIKISHAHVERGSVRCNKNETVSFNLEEICSGKSK